MSKMYDPEILRRLQLCELSILKDFIKVCEENGLSYFGLAGTGIGALRHGGFIPWDDDIDVGMPRADYNKAMEIFQRDYADKYTVVNAERYDDFPVMNTHIIINDSKFLTEEDKRGNYPTGIFLDVFPMDKTAPTEEERKKHLKKTWILNKLLIVKHIPFPNLPFKGFTKKAVHCCTAVAWFFLNLFCISHKKLYDMCVKECTKYNDSDTGFLAYCCDTLALTNIYNEAELYPLRKIKFEDVELNFPNNLEKSLEILYGDYMQLPPVEDRKNHSPCELEFPKEA